MKILIRWQCSFRENLIYLDVAGEQYRRNDIFKATTYVAFLYHKSATTCQTDSSKVSNSKLKPELCNCLKTETIESTAPPQQPNK